MTKVMFHGCKSAFQDGRYGEQMRVFNLCKSGNPGSSKWRCSVCFSEISKDSGEDKKKR